MNMRSSLASVLGTVLLWSAVTSQAAERACDSSTGGDTASVAAALGKLRHLLSAPQRALMERPLERDEALRWSNLPVNIVPRVGLRLGDLDDKQAAAVRKVFEAALSACGLKLLDDVRSADDFLLPLDKRAIGWDGRNYYISVLGDSASGKAWMLQVGGHHLAYNFMFNGRQAGATPLFFGSEPIRFSLQGREYEPMAAQSTAMRDLAQAIAVHEKAKLSGTFTDVVKGVVAPTPMGQPQLGGIDKGFPHTYPTGTDDRGVLYSELTAAQQALVRKALRSYASLPGAAISKSLVKAYEAEDALRQTYVGYSGATDFSARGAYVRIDGPRIWMELVVQPAVANPAELHYHALWRDKLADYGGEVGH